MISEQLQPVIEPHAMKHLQSNPIAARKAQIATQKRNKAIGGLARLELLAMFAQIDKQRRGGVSAGQVGEVVAGTRPYKHPELDDDDKALDRHEREIERALDEIVDRIAVIAGIGLIVGKSRAPSKREQEIAADVGVNCEDCGRVVACTPADRLLGNACETCNRAWRRAGMPDKPKWLKERQAQRDAASA